MLAFFVQSVVADAPSIGEEISDPEKVLKEGTLEEAAKALEVLEQKESAAVLKEDEPIDCTSDDYVLISKEDVCIPAKGDVDDPSEEKTGSGNASQRRDSSEFILEVEEEHGFYPRGLHMIVKSISLVAIICMEPPRRDRNLYNFDSS